MIGFVDHAIVQYQPWLLTKKQDPESQKKLDDILYSAAEVIRIATALLAPIMPEATAAIWTQLGMTTPVDAVRIDQLTCGQYPAGQELGELGPIFPESTRRRPSTRFRRSTTAKWIASTPC